MVLAGAAVSSLGAWAEGIRADFPILQRLVNGQPLVYLDNAATSQKPQQVLAAMEHYYTHSNANVHRGVHTLSTEATHAYETARQKIAAFIQAASPAEIIYTRNATEAINLVAYAWGLENLKAGDEVILSVMEHHSNLIPWQLIAQKTGCQLRFLEVTSTGELNLDQLRQYLESGRVKLVSLVHVSNMLGCVNPIADICALAHTYDAKVLIDACQSVPHMPVNVQAVDCDWLVFSGHKMCGPTGIGILYGKQELLRGMPPFLGGGEMIADVFLEHATYADIPHKFEAGTPAIAQAVGLGAAVDYLTGLGMDKIHAYEQELVEQLYTGMVNLPGVTVFGPRQRAGLVSFTLEGVHPHDVSTLFDQEGIAIRAGHHCTQPLHRHLGIQSSARASVYFYNTPAEVERFLETLAAAVAFFQSL